MTYNGERKPRERARNRLVVSVVSVVSLALGCLPGGVLLIQLITAPPDERVEVTIGDAAAPALNLETRETSLGSLPSRPIRAERSEVVKGPKRRSRLVSDSLPVLLSGTVRSVDGTPISRALVRVQAPGSLDGEALTSITRRSIEDLAAAERSSMRMWGTHTDRHGRFRIHGETASERLQITASKEGHADRRVSASAGATKLEIQLTRNSLSGRVLVAEGVSSSRIRVHVHRAGSAGGRGIEVVQLGPDGAFKVSVPEAGLYELSFSYRPRSEYLLTVGPILVPTENPDGQLAMVPWYRVAHPSAHSRQASTARSHRGPGRASISPVRCTRSRTKS